jgi:serine/threonine protein phosphatase 1
MSDIHGCYEKYRQMLEKINFSENDTLYVLGDVVDRGPQPVKVLQDMRRRVNVRPILGNHDYTARTLLAQFEREFAEKDFGPILNLWRIWQSDGGWATQEDFERLPPEEQEALLEYMAKFSLCETIETGGRKFILTHAGLPKGSQPENLPNYSAYDFVSATVDYNKTYLDDIFLVTGHRPTFLIDMSYEGRIFRQNNHIVIDTGAVFGGALGCLCLDTDEEFYV